jgi:hypothetical protein
LSRWVLSLKAKRELFLEGGVSRKRRLGLRPFCEASSSVLCQPGASGWPLEQQSEESGEKNQSGDAYKSRAITSCEVAQTANPERSEAAAEIAYGVDERDAASRGSFRQR